MLCWLACAASAGDDPPVDYNREVRPILAKNCFPCHGSDEKKRRAGLRLDEREAALTPGKKRPAAITPGQANASELIRRVSSEDDTERMPPAETGEKLTPAQAALLKRWINQGANYAKHWSFVKPVRPPLPAVPAGWARNAIDHFIHARLLREGLTPSPATDRHQLLRRVSLDLRGLPPTPAEVEVFEQDTSPDAYEKMVNRFLADPAFGERWARVWLDLARYADSAGYGSDPLRPNMWRYRDWVIDAFNRNLPYDQFTLEQLAGDLLPRPTLEQRVATAFHRNTMTNTEGGTDDEEFRVAAVKDRANTTAQVWMGLTMGCAQCHSHKYDPISQHDYYRFYAIFNQTADTDQPNEVPTLPAPTAAQLARNKKIDEQVAAVRQRMLQPTFELIAAQWAWEESLRANTPWTVLQPLILKSDRQSLKADQAGIIRAEGPGKDKETYQITAKVPLAQLTAIRLENVSSKGAVLQTGGALARLQAYLRPADQPSIRGRYVRIELPGPNRILSLAEVQVFSGTENVALGAEASQSSTDFHGEAVRALDGNTNGEYFQAHSVTHTKTEANPWWEARLPAETPLDRIVLWNRTGGVEDRLRGARVQVLSDRHEVVWEQTVKDIPQPTTALSLDGQPLELKPGVEVPSRSEVVGITAAHQTVLFLAPKGISTGDEVLLTIKLHGGSDTQPPPAQFRLSITNDPAQIPRAAIPGKLLALLDVDPSQRSPTQLQDLAHYFRGIAPQNQPLRDELARFERSRPKIVSLPVMTELPAHQKRVTKLMHKGNFLAPGETVEPRLPSAFALTKADQPVTRLDVAKWLVHPDNPLTARVAVNRLWAQLFGTGLVEAEEDWGTQGDVPSHPELLDWLAMEYQHTLKWDTKALLKLMVTSATYRQTSRVTPELLKRDPRNRLLTRGPRYRLEAETIRDQALALSGLLSRKLGGPSVYPPQPDGLWQAAFNGERTWATSQGEDRYRRGLYTFWRRTIPYPSMAAFDAPSRELCQVKRVRSNTPVQAFVTLNDPVYVEAAQALARRIVREGGTNVEERVRFALKLCTCRPAEERQVIPLVALFQRELARYRETPAEAQKLTATPRGPLPAGLDVPELAAWTVVANVLLNLDAVLTKG
jgi:hypothetical protein